MNKSFIILLIFIGIAVFIGESEIDPQRILVSPCIAHPFGTDWLGRDLFLRTFKGIIPSLRISLMASFLSVTIAFLFGVLGGKVLSFFIDFFQSLPQLVTLIFFCYLFGGGELGVIIALSLSHWVRLARLVETETKKFKGAFYLKQSKALGHGPFKILYHHYFPLLLPDLFWGFLLLLPQMVLHESSLSFLGIGLPPDSPSIGLILSETVKELTGHAWWTAFFPGAILLILLLLIGQVGNSIRKRYVDYA